MRKRIVFWKVVAGRNGHGQWSYGRLNNMVEVACVYYAASYPPFKCYL